MEPWIPSLGSFCWTTMGTRAPTDKTRKLVLSGKPVIISWCGPSPSLNTEVVPRALSFRSTSPGSQGAHIRGVRCSWSPPKSPAEPLPLFLLLLLLFLAGAAWAQVSEPGGGSWAKDIRALFAERCSCGLSILRSSRGGKKDPKASVRHGLLTSSSKCCLHSTAP